MNLNFRESAFLRYATAILSVQFAIIARTQLDDILGQMPPTPHSIWRC